MTQKHVSLEHIEGRGKYQGMLGAMLMETEQWYSI